MRLRGWLAWHLAKPWLAALHDHAATRLDELETSDADEQQRDYRLGVWVGKISAMGQLRGELRRGRRPA